MTERLRLGIIRRLENEKYGIIPDKPMHLRVKRRVQTRALCCGRIELSRLEAFVELDEAENGLYLYELFPTRGAASRPAILLLKDGAEGAQNPGVASRLAELGYAVFLLPVCQISGNNGSFRESPLARRLSPPRRASTAAGKIALWTWGALRAVEIISADKRVIASSILLIGGGALGEAALLTAALSDAVEAVIADSAPLTAPREESYLYCGKYSTARADSKRYACALYSALSQKPVIVTLPEDTEASPDLEAEALFGAVCAAALRERYGSLEQRRESEEGLLLSSEGRTLYLRPDIFDLSTSDIERILSFIPRKMLENENES